MSRSKEAEFARLTVRGRLLRTIRESAVPVQTSCLVAVCAFDKKDGRQQVWNQLRALRAAGVIASEVREVQLWCDGDAVREHRRRYRTAFWSLLRRAA